MTPPMAYDNTFFDDIESGSVSAARTILPLVLSLYPAHSIIDVGCGRGAWLKVCHELGISDVLGVDGPYVEQAKLLIDPSRFHAHDLRFPLKLARRYDLALCLEVAEHLPSSCATSLVETLTTLAPCVLFSAAIPGQGGIDHINEQWPEYWQKLFSDRGYRKLDPVRRQVFQDERVAWWYQQNTYLYASESVIESSSELTKELKRQDGHKLDVMAIHIINQYRSDRESVIELIRTTSTMLYQRVKRALGVLQ